MSKFLDIPPELCHNCGTCVAVCPNGALSAGPSRPYLSAPCKECGKCYAICPGLGVDFSALNSALYPKNIPDVYFGCYRATFLGRRAEGPPPGSSSGGVVTTLLADAMDKGLIRTAIVVDMDPQHPWAARVTTAHSAGEILEAAGSKYTLVPVNAILGRARTLPGPIAYVGLPCHLHGLRKLQLEKSPATGAIAYSIGLFCGFNLLPEATLFLLKKMRLTPDSVKKIYYRHGRWPGSFVVETVDGRTMSLPKKAFNFLHLAYSPPRCTLCPDLFAECSDVSVGDYWPKNGGEREGLSSIIVRNERGQELLDNAVASGAVELTPLSESDLYRSHAHLIGYKKRSVWVRIRHSARKPSYVMNKPHLPPFESIKAFFSSVILRLGRSNVSKRLMGISPIGLLGKCAELARSTGTKSSRRHSSRYWTLSDVATHWDHTDTYDDLNERTYSYMRRFIDAYKIAESRIGDQTKALDISCRTGMGSLYFGSRKKIDLTGMAPSASQLQTARARLEEAGIPFKAVEWNEPRLPFADESFDLILSFETIEHIFQYDDLIAEFHRVLKPGGLALLTTPNVLWDPIHSLADLTGLHHGEGPHRFIPRREIIHNLKTNGFAIEKEISTVLIPYGPPWLTTFGERIERSFPEWIRRTLCLRRIFLCVKEKRA